MTAKTERGHVFDNVTPEQLEHAGYTNSAKAKRRADFVAGTAKTAQRTPDETLSLGILDEWSVDITGPRTGLDEVLRRWRSHTDLLTALRTIAAAPTIGGISAGERKGLVRAAAIARAAIAQAEE